MPKPAGKRASPARLSPFVFGEGDFVDDVIHHRRRVTALNDLVLAEMFHDVVTQDGIQNFAWRQRVLIFLVRPQFRAWRFADGITGDDLPFPVDPAGEIIDFRFENIGNDRESAAHVAIQGAVTDGQFGFISGGQNERN